MMSLAAANIFFTYFAVTQTCFYLAEILCVQRMLSFQDRMEAAAQGRQAQIGGRQGQPAEAAHHVARAA